MADWTTMPNLKLFHHFCIFIVLGDLGELSTGVSVFSRFVSLDGV
jgi:hypothetical protein